MENGRDMATAVSNFSGLVALLQLCLAVIFVGLCKFVSLYPVV